MIKKLPNILSVMRIVLSVSLFFLTDTPVFFAAIYLICGATDVADGYIARKQKLETAFGAKLDSVGDFIMFAVVMRAIFAWANIINIIPIIVTIIIIALIRLANLAITRKKFHQFAVMHSYGNKLTGFFLFLFPLFCFVLDSQDFVAAMLCFVAGLSAVEEMAMLLCSGSYDINRKGFFFKV